MRLRSILAVWFLIAVSLVGIAHADTPEIGLTQSDTELVSNASPVSTPGSFVLLSAVPPPPPPPPSCAANCLLRYQSCLNAGVNPGICGAKYNYCRMNCSGPPILTQ